MLQLATVGDWDEVRRLSVQIHDLHAAWRPDIYFHSETPYPKEQYLDDIRKRLVYVAKIDTVVVGYVVLSFVTKEGPGTITCKSLRLDSICVDQGLRGHGIGKQMVEDIAFITAFTDRMANAVRCPVSRTIPDAVKEKLDTYLNRKRKA